MLRGAEIEVLMLDLSGGRQSLLHSTHDYMHFVCLQVMLSMADATKALRHFERHYEHSAEIAEEIQNALNLLSKVPSWQTWQAGKKSPNQEAGTVNVCTHFCVGQKIMPVILT